GPCDPPVPSKSAAPVASAGNWDRTAATSSTRPRAVRSQVPQDVVKDAVVPVVEPFVGCVDADARLEVLTPGRADLERLGALLERLQVERLLAVDPERLRRLAVGELE